MIYWSPFMDDDQIQRQMDELDYINVDVCLEDEPRDLDHVFKRFDRSVKLPPPYMVDIDLDNDQSLSASRDSFFTFTSVVRDEAPVPPTTTKRKTRKHKPNLAVVGTSLYARAVDIFEVLQTKKTAVLDIYDRRAIDVTLIARQIGVVEKVSKSVFAWKGLDCMYREGDTLPMIILNHLRMTGKINITTYKLDNVASIRRRLCDVMIVFEALGLVQKTGRGLYAYIGK